MKNSITEIKSELASIEKRVTQIEAKISDIKDRNLEMMQKEEEKDLSIKRNEKILQGLSDPSEKAT